MFETYDKPGSMEPMLPGDPRKELSALAVELLRKSAGLGSAVHPVTSRQIAELVRLMNSYYSNLIEGHNTHPADIEKAMRQDYSSEPAQRALQIESAAHVEVQKLIEHRLLEDPTLPICGEAFLRWTHKELYKRFPDEFRKVRSTSGREATVYPGKLRDCEVEVGRHHPPAHGSLGMFLTRFEDVYDVGRFDPVKALIAAAASHHRLAWIHPFLDGNGRVIRLFTHAYCIQAGLDGHGMWAVSRGLARRRDDYMDALAGADADRYNDLDGRGNLSEKGLAAFCRFFMETAIDQVDFMADLLELDSIQGRIAAYAERYAVLEKMPTETGRLLCDVFLRGEVSRGDAAHILGKPERTARRIIGTLIEDELLDTDGTGQPLRLALSTKVVGYYFPRLYPEGVEL